MSEKNKSTPAVNQDAPQESGAEQAAQNNNTPDLEGGKPTDKDPGDGNDGGGKQDPAPESGADKEKDKTEPEDAPTDDYGDFAMPKDVAVSEEDMASFKTLAQELGLSKENAQKLVDLQTGLIVKQQQEVARFRQELKEKCKQEFGEDKLPAVLADAAKAVDRFGGDELRQELDMFGLGDSPVIIRTFAKIGRELGEDRTVISGSAPAGDVTLAEALYGKK